MFLSIWFKNINVRNCKKRVHEKTVTKENNITLKGEHITIEGCVTKGKE